MFQIKILASMRDFLFVSILLPVWESSPRGEILDDAFDLWEQKHKSKRTKEKARIASKEDVELNF